MSNIEVALTIAVTAAVTILLRFLPFIAFSKLKSTPKIITYLSKCLPFAIMAMLVVYCLKSVNPTAYPFGLPELIGVVTVVLLHILKRNTLLSIVGGTAVYMLLIQLVF